MPSFEDFANLDQDELKECENCHLEVDKHLEICPHCGEWTSLPMLGKTGNVLPIGLETKDGTLKKEFEIEPLTIVKEKKINKFWGPRKKNVVIGEYISSILAHTVINIGGIDITKKKIANRMILIQKMYSADVMYMYAYLRLISMGKELRLKGIVCEKCNHRHEYIGDVSTIGIRSRSDLASLRKEVTLRDGFELDGGQRKKIILQPSLFSWLTEEVIRSEDQTSALLSLIANSICEIQGMPSDYPIAPAFIESNFTKYDISYLENYINDNLMLGPKFELEGQCPKCGFEYYQGISWSYDDFFSTSCISLNFMRSSKNI